MLDHQSASQLIKTVRRVHHPPTWRDTPYVVDFVMLTRELGGPELLSVYQFAKNNGLVNARVIAPSTLEWSSLFQPRFYTATRREPEFRNTPRLCLALAGADGMLVTPSERVRFWLQSIVFLAAVTMSAAIIQGRWSAGTLASKFDKIWTAGEASKLSAATDLADLELFDRVRLIAANSETTAVSRLLEVRSLFDLIVDRLAQHVPASRVHLRSVGSSDPRLSRFGFVRRLRQSVASIQAIIVYGSSVSSEEFADYDVVLVVEDPQAVLAALANTRPMWMGKELNLSVYSPSELWRMQLLSGDNLADYGVCVFGEVDLPEKTTELLLTRNISFGVVRQRQQLGMVERSLCEWQSDGDDRKSLYEYFAKIPANVAKGTFGAVGQRRTNEDVYSWLLDRCAFDTKAEQVRALSGFPATALANSAVATGRVLRELNEQFGIARSA